MTSKYSELYSVLKKEFKIKEFDLLNKMQRKIVFFGICELILICFIAIDLFSSSYTPNMPLIVLVGVISLVFGIYIIIVRNKINYTKSNLHKVLRTYLNKQELLEFNKTQFIKFASEDISELEYLSLVKSELLLISKMIDEDSSFGNINIIVYQKSIEDIFKYLKKSLEIEIINLDEYNVLKKEWDTRINSTYTTYLGTDLEIDLKYLSCINI